MVNKYNLDTKHYILTIIKYPINMQKTVENDKFQWYT